MKKHTSSRSGLLLMEIIIAILFFSVVSAVCLQLFVKAHNLGQDTTELDGAVRQTSSVAEVLSQTEQPMERLQEIYPYSDTDKNGVIIYFDEDFKNCRKEDSLYHLDITLTTSDKRLDSYRITVFANNKSDEIYTLDITAYRQFTP